jgi:hypothetical protein
MDELSKAKKAYDDAQALVDKLKTDLGNALPGTAAYTSIQTDYEKAKKDRDAKKKIYDPLQKAADKAAQTQTDTAADVAYKKTQLQQKADTQIPVLEQQYNSAVKAYKGDPNDKNKGTAYLNAMAALNSAYTDFEKQGLVFNRLVIQQKDGNVVPAGTPAAAVETAPVVTFVAGSIVGDEPVRVGVGRRVVAPTAEVVAEEPPPPDDVPVAKPKKVVITKAEVDTKLAELNLTDTPENRKTARQALKAGTTAAPAVVDASWEPIFKQNYPQYSWMFTDLDRTKYADVFTLFSKAIDPKTGKQIMEDVEFDRRWKGTSFYRELETSKKGRELSAAIGNFTWGSGNLAKFLTKATQFGYEGENLKQQAYKELFSKVDGKYANDLAVGEIKKSTPYLSLKDIGKQYFWDIGDSQIEQVLSGVEDAVTGIATSREDLIRKARLYAKGKYAHLSEQIDGGLTMEDLAASYREKAAQLLELDPLTMNFDRDYSDALGSVDRPRVLSLSEWETELRTNGKYKYSFTKQANQDATDIGLAIARAFGKVQ